MSPPNAPLVMALVLGLLTACGGQPDDGEADRPTLAFVSNGIDPFWVIARSGVEAAGRDLGVGVSVHMPSEGAESQKRILEDLLTRQVDGIAVSPMDPDNQTELLDMVAARTHLITQDSDAPDSQRLCFLGVDNYDAGRLCGELVREALPDGGEIMLFVGRLEQDNARRRRQGLIDALLGRTSDPTRHDPPGAPVSGDGYTVLGTLTDQFDYAAAKANTEDALSRYPGLDGVVGLFSYNTPMCLEAVRQAGRTGDIAVVGFDEREETLAGIREGVVHGTVVQNPYMYGYRSIEVLAALAAGDRSVLPEGGFLHVPARQIRAADVDAFAADLAAKLGDG